MLGYIVVFCLMTAVTQGCLMADKWTIMMTDVNSVTSGANVTSTLYYDYTLKRIAIQYRDFVTNEDIKREVTDYNYGYRYTILPDNSCTFVAMGGEPMLERNISAMPGAISLGSSYVGGGSNTLNYEAWKFPLGQIDIRMTLTLPECVPLVESVSGSFNGGSFEYIFFFNNYVTGVADQDVFNFNMCT